LNQNQQHNSEAPPTTSLEEVRKRLQSFGYLNGRIERFYLLSISRTASQVLNRLVLSFRVGLLAGTVAAILMAAGTLIFNPELLRRKFDLLLLFLYFETFFVFLLTVLEFLLIFLVSILLRITGGRRLFLAGQAVSFLIGLAFFGYFFYWARTQIEYLRLFSNIAIVAMFLILTLSCIFVAKCTWLGFLVAFRESQAGWMSPNWKRFNVEFLLGLTAIVILSPFVFSQSHPKPDSSAPIAVLSTPDRWLLVAVDGLSLEIVERKADAVPYLQSLMKQSPPAKLKTSEPPVPPVIWTSVATGVPSAEHGIRTSEVRRWRGQSSWFQVTPFQLAVHSIMVHAGFGQRQPVSGYLRKVKTFWEILSDHGLRIGVVNWWGSWPARETRGWNISERYYYKLAAGTRGQDETFPRELFQQYASLYEGDKNKIQGPDLDLFYMQIFQRQLQKDPVRVGALYLPGFDILNYEHFEARRMDPFTYTDEFVDHLRWLDSQIKELHEKNPGYRMLIVFYQGRSLTGQNSGVLIPDAHLKDRASFSEYDIVPLILYTCGLPVAQNMRTDLIRAVADPQKLPLQRTQIKMMISSSNR
jgi:type I phosphodiesterase/nucleotide pyrophosphatase